jgi:hypothetical protein
MRAKAEPRNILIEALEKLPSASSKSSEGKRSGRVSDGKENESPNPNKIDASRRSAKFGTP